MKKAYLIGVVLFLLCVVVGVVSIARTRQTEQVACTMEAKMCPDGSYVGRGGPSCEFAACPEMPISTVPVNFSHEGVVTVNNPGQKTDIPYLVYEEAGAPALSRELVFDSASMCGDANKTISCQGISAPFEISFQGKRVKVDGVEMGAMVLVRTMTTVEDATSSASVALKKATVTAAMGKSVSALGITITPQEVVEDSRCPSGVQCIWAGTVQLKVSVKDASGEVLRVLVLNQATTTKGVEVTLVGADPYPASGGGKIGSGEYVFTFDVKKKDIAAEPVKATGILRGKVNVGPICPVEQEGVPCPVPPEAYTSREIVIYKTNGVTEVARKAINTDGTYSFTLQAGSYILDLAQAGIDSSADVPHEFTLAKGEIGYFNFSIDTGIR